MRLVSDITGDDEISLPCFYGGTRIRSGWGWVFSPFFDNYYLFSARMKKILRGSFLSFFKVDIIYSIFFMIKNKLLHFDLEKKIYFYFNVKISLISFHIKGNLWNGNVTWNYLNKVYSKLRLCFMCWEL